MNLRNTILIVSISGLLIWYGIVTFLWASLKKQNFQQIINQKRCTAEIVCNKSELMENHVHIAVLCQNR